MGLREAVLAGTNAAFAAVGNVKTSATFISRSTSYNPTTGAVTKSDTSQAVQGVLDSPRTTYKWWEEAVANLTPHDIRQIFYVPAASLTSTPKLKDVVVIDSEEWRVVAKARDPAKVIWILGLQGK